MVTRVIRFPLLIMPISNMQWRVEGGIFNGTSKVRYFKSKVRYYVRYLLFFVYSILDFVLFLYY